MKRVYIINDRVSSSINGIGTYVKQMIRCFSGLDVFLTILEFNSKSDCFLIEYRNDTRYFCFPNFGDGCIHNHFLIIDKFLRLYIEDSKDNIFIFNYSPFSSLMEKVKESFPLSKLVYVIHDLFWTSKLFGDVNAYVEVLSNRESSLYFEKYAYLYQRYDEEVKMCRYSDVVISLSLDTYELLQEYYFLDSGKLVLIPNALFEEPVVWSEEDKVCFRNEMSLGDDKILLFVGRLIAIVR